MYKAVVGLGFGDEGKGLTTNYLAMQNPEALITRFSGGQQAGHTVVKDGVRHIFSNFGSGTLNGNPTYWSKYCTVDPVGIINEFDMLRNQVVLDVNIYIDAKCPVTTPYEKHITDRNGTCGVGVGQTLLREDSFYSLLFEDLFNPTVLKIKMDLIRQLYYCDYGASDLDMEIFYHCVTRIKRNACIHLTYGNPILSNDSLPTNTPIIFESSQGLLLDQHYGFFPHVTRSNVGSTNILEMGYEPKMFLVTRAYQTRHGNGPMTHEFTPHKIKSNPLETNVLNDFQGEFRVSLLDIDLLQYAISKDPYINTHRDNLVITCVDHIMNDLRFIKNGSIIENIDYAQFLERISNELGCKHLYISESDDSSLQKVY